MQRDVPLSNAACSVATLDRLASSVSFAVGFVRGNHRPPKRFARVIQEITIVGLVSNEPFGLALGEATDDQGGDEPCFMWRSTCCV